MQAAPASIPPGELQRDGSTWQGGRHGPPQDGVGQAYSADLALRAWLGNFTANVSPAALSLAWQDWASHLALSPDKQKELTLLAQNGMRRWIEFAQASTIGAPFEPVAPLAQDKRFSDPAWNAWPWNVVSQGFLLTQQWWHRATCGVNGVAPHHTDVMTFMARQLLDALAPSNFILTNPAAQQATVATGGRNLLHGFLRATTDMQHALARTTSPLAFGPGVDVARTPGRVVMSNRLIELLRYDCATPDVHERPLLFVPAWIMKYYILDLSPDNSLVRYLIGRGHTVYMISWKNPGPEDRDLSLEDYRRLGVMAAIDAIAARSGASALNACGYCLGGTLLAIAAAAMARDGDMRLASVSLLAAQVDFTEPGELSLFIDHSEVSFLEAAMWERGYLDAHHMAGAFQLLRSNDLVWSRRLRHYLLDIPDKANDLTSWNADATRMPYRMHSDYLRKLFLDNSLASARYLVDGRPIALNDIRIPLFAVGTRTDHVAPWRSVYKIMPLTDTEVTFLLTSGGHNAGVVSPPGTGLRSYQIATHGPNAVYTDPDSWERDAEVREGSWWPAWEAWLADRAGAMQAPPEPVIGSGPAPGNYVLAR